MLTVYGIETGKSAKYKGFNSIELQQCLPFTVLKLQILLSSRKLRVATVLTVYGIETNASTAERTSFIRVATVLTVYGIETRQLRCLWASKRRVATVLTVYGIETFIVGDVTYLHFPALQQCLPFTVLKRFIKANYLLSICCNSAYRLRY